MADKVYQWTDDPMLSGVKDCDPDVVNDCLMHLKYENTSNAIQNMYTTGQVETQTRAFLQLQEMRHSTFDLSKFEVVGSPTITDDGVASGFSDSSYLKVLDNFNPQGSWEITSKIKAENYDHDSYFLGSFIADGSYGLTLGLTLSGQIKMWISSNGNSWNVVSGLTSSTKLILDNYYIIKNGFNGSEYYFEILKEDETLLERKFVTRNDKIYGTKLLLGTSFNNTFYLRGSIDIKHFSITVDGKEVFSGNKTGLDVIKPDNYEVVGSPVISDDGVASGFSNSNYIGISLPIVTNNITLEGIITVNSIDTFQTIFNTEENWKINVYLENGTFKIDVGDGTAWNYKENCVIGNVTVDNTYRWKVIITPSSIKCYLDNINTNSYNISDFNLSTSKFCFSYRKATNAANFTGSIDLNAFKIYVDGNLVYQPCLKIPYTESKTGSKIVDVAYRDRVIDLYEQQGQAGYYTIDEENKNFTLPMGEIYGMIENKASKKEIYNKLTNCLSEVPQRIKLELTDGVLTLKAGSQVIIPNGVGVFDEVTITQDINYPSLSHATVVDRVVLLNPDKNSITGLSALNTSSGTIQPSSPLASHVWYDTTNNLVKRLDDTGTTWTSGYSLPICIGNYIKDSGFTSIDQVFNGVGYIGPTVWVDKGVKGLIPNGRNEDGSLNNIEFTTSKVLTRTFTGTFDAVLGLDGISIGQLKAGVYSFDYKNNYCMDGDLTWKAAIIGSFTQTNGVISNFQLKLPFRAIDYSDKSTVSGWGMPSDKYIDLTLGASGSIYTAPANGWYSIEKGAGVSSSYLQLKNISCSLKTEYSSKNSTDFGKLFLPARKGQQVIAEYNMTGTTNYFIFIYAEGEV